MEQSQLILDEVRGMRADLSDVKGSYATLRSVVLGNGSKGHEQRIEQIENWKHLRPTECPVVVKNSDIYKRRGLEIAIMSLIIGTIQIGIAYFGS